jgi:hypothetical protein
MVTVCWGSIEWIGIGFKGVEVTNGAKVTEMAKMAKMFKVYTWAARHATVCLMSEMSKMSEMSEMTARHVIVGCLESSAV